MGDAPGSFLLNQVDQLLSSIPQFLEQPQGPEKLLSVAVACHKRMLAGRPETASRLGTRNRHHPRALMRLAPLLGLLALALPLLTCSAAAAAMVISVGDGDTLRVLHGGRKLAISVAFIDAPEMMAQAPHRQQGRKALKALLPDGSRVTLKTLTKDRYRRNVDEVLALNGPNARLAGVNKPQSKRLTLGKHGQTNGLIAPPSAEVQGQKGSCSSHWRE